MLIGAGEMCELAAKHFLNSGAKGVMVTNRTFERAEKLAEEFSGEAVRFEALLDHLHHADIVLSSTGAPHHIIGPKDVKEVLKRRRFKPIFFIDIAVPRDIDPKVDQVENAYLFTVDNLQEIIQANLAQRSLEAEKAEQIISQEIGQFHKWLSTLEVTPAIVALRNRFDEIRRAELDKTITGWKDLPPDAEKRLEALTLAMMNKLLHAPTSVRKQAGQGGRVDLYVDALRQLFELEALQRDDEELELEE
jgi:glutamyl-tRNA reductase